MYIFGEEWIQTLKNNINTNANYKQAAATWEGALALLVFVPQLNETHGVFLDLHKGTCLQAHAFNQSLDEDKTKYILKGESTTWLQILGGKMPPLMALMQGKLKLEKGSLFTLSKYANAAKEIVQSASSILNAQTPENWL